jgi:hypothetical protein
MLNKANLSFYLSVIFFVLIIFYASFVYINWDEPVVISEDSVEINLPVIDWARYLDLSKHPE